MISFKTQFNFDNSIVTCAGTVVECVDKKTGEKVLTSGRRYTYKQEYDKQGKRHLVISDTEDVYNTIQSYKDDTDIYKIVSRYFNGDVTVLDKNKGFYADVTKIPHDIREWHNKIEEGQNIFAGLPTDLKREFGNDLNQFITSVFNQDFEEKYKNYVSRKNVNTSVNVTDNVISNSVNTIDNLQNDNGGVK